MRYILLLLFPFSLLAQDTIQIPNVLPEVIFLEEKKEEERLYNPQQIVELDQKKISRLLPSTTADVLQKSGEVVIQQSQSGGGSPIVRGFEANRVLLVIDGVRMNNAIFRSGHLQNSISTSPNMLSKLDVIFGPASVKYGSDALGGVIHIHSKSPTFNQESKSNFSQKYSSVNQGVSLHFDQSWSKNKWSYLSAITINKYGNVKMGANRLHGYEEWGKEAHITDGEIQLKTAYNQIDWIQKFRYDGTKNWSHLFNLQYSSTTDLDRFDKLNDQSGGLPKFEEWYYGPQKRFLSSVSSQYNKSHKLFDEFNNVTSFQAFEESRHSKKFGSDINERFEKVLVLGNTTDFIKKIGYHSFNYGLDIQNNLVESTANQGTPTRYADGGSAMQLFSVYGQYKIPYGVGLNYLSAGVRYNYSGLQARFEDTATYSLPFNEIDVKNQALTASLGWQTALNKKLDLGASLSSGFRSPNVDDITKVFEKSGLVTVPNDQLKPEYSYNGELNLSAKINKNWSWNASVYYTILKDVIVKQAFVLNGQDSITYDGEYLPIVANKNAQEARVYGFYTKMNIKLSKQLRWINTLNRTFGIIKEDDTPLDHIPPLFAKSELQLSKKDHSLTLYSLYNGWKRAQEYSTNGSDNLSEATIDGNPAWWTLNLSYLAKVNSKITVQIALENILDVHYKTYSSGISSPGRNVIISLNSSF
jgi:hemoglobin/transferrin/lactoferrin receptor protein